MRPIRSFLTVFWAAAVVAALLVAGPAGARAAELPRAQLTGYSCRLAIDPGARAIAATAVMRPITGTRHMAIRFDLFSRVPGRTVTEVHGGDLGQFTAPSDPTLGQLPADVWRVHKLVVPLAAPAAYRLRAEFRWTGSGGRVLSTVTRMSPACAQRELRPDLVMRSITVTAIPNRPHRDLYTALIDNTGNSAAGPFSVLFAPADGSAATTRQISLLSAHSHRQISFIGPLCTAAAAPTITADSALQVADLNRSDNALVATCPVTPAG
jgi:hypothetical protein